jgi:hypothetical protein
MMKLPDLILRKITPTQRLTTGAATDLLLAVSPLHLRERQAGVFRQVRGRFNAGSYLADQQVFELGPDVLALFIVALSMRELELQLWNVSAVFRLPFDSLGS